MCLMLPVKKSQPNEWNWCNEIYSQVVVVQVIEIQFLRGGKQLVYFNLSIFQMQVLMYMVMYVI